MGRQLVKHLVIGRCQWLLTNGSKFDKCWVGNRISDCGHCKEVDKWMSLCVCVCDSNGCVCDSKECVNDSNGSLLCSRNIAYSVQQSNATISHCLDNFCTTL